MQRAGIKEVWTKKCITVAFEMEYVVNVQYFKKPIDELVPKELAIAPLRGVHCKPTLFTFKPPCPWTDLPVAYQRLNEMMYQQVHKLFWRYGSIPWEDVSETVRKVLPNAALIYVKGTETKQWLSTIVGESVLVVDVDTLECPSLRELKEMIPGVSGHHKTAYGLYSAVENVDLLRNWLIQRY
uniref:AsIV-cont00014-ORF1 n=1 Tax=Apophua simplicipes ichnovirus TaxID=1329648 RepID=S5DMH0_9VIRU|nr:AsIV-cont00014-ORF1 [Apophua simplicipes ichnovirus]